VYVTVNDTNNLYKRKYLYSEYGLSSIQINASCENHYDPIDTLTFDEITLIYIYDGVINDVRTNINGFSLGIYFINLLAYWDESDIEKTFSSFTSCNTGVYFSQSKTTIQKITGNNCSYAPLHLDDSSSLDISNDKLCSFMNNNKLCIILQGSSSYYSNNSYDYNRKILCGYSAMGFFVVNSSARIVSSYITKCYWGVNTPGSYVSLYRGTPDDLTGKPKTEITYCTTGIYAYENTTLKVRNTNVSHCNTGIRAFDYCNIIIDRYGSNFDYGVYGLRIEDASIQIEKSTFNNNSSYGIRIVNSTCSIIYCDINDNYYGFWLSNQSNSIYTDSNCNNNDKYGIVCTEQSKLKLSIIDSTYNISGNDTWDIYGTWGAQINIYTVNTIANITPSPNNEPTWTGYPAGTMIGYTKV
jgi:hypothetical protein